MNLAIVKYNAGNTRSVINALERLGISPVVTDDASILQSADRVIFPGVGEASSAMGYLRERGLDEVIVKLEQPVLGICLGMQLLCSHSEENDTSCLGIFEAEVKLFPDVGLKVPHMGWNELVDTQTTLFKDLPSECHVYFVHGYQVPLSADTIATSDYGGPFSAALQKRNFYGVQFHPEKSGSIGERILRNFLEVV